MINPFFKEISPFCYNYFSTLLSAVENNTRRFPQAIIFEGIDTKLQFLFTLELACELNSIHHDKAVCEKWIKNHSHPTVNYISQIHNKPDDDDTKSVISTKQAKVIESSIKTTSDYHRFFIFFSSQQYNYTADELKYFEILGYNSDINYSIEPLEYTTFHERALNILLKSVEEPPEKTTFVFLTNSKENILPTITSRCQVFKIGNYVKNTANPEIQKLFNFYPEINYTNAYELSDVLLNYAKNNEVNILTILNEFTLYLKSLIAFNISQYQKLTSDIKIINQASKMIKGNVNPKNSVETMFFRLARGY